MYLVANRLFVWGAFAGQFEQMFAHSSGRMEQVPGFVRNLVLRPRHPDEQPYVVMTFWESLETFNAWTQSESFQRAHGGARHAPQEMYWRQSELEVHEVIQDTGEA